MKTLVSAMRRAFPWRTAGTRETWSRPEQVPGAWGKDATANSKINKEQWLFVAITQQACDLLAPLFYKSRSMTNAVADLRAVYGRDQGWKYRLEPKVLNGYIIKEEGGDRREIQGQFRALTVRVSWRRERVILATKGNWTVAYDQEKNQKARVSWRKVFQGARDCSRNLKRSY